MSARSAECRCKSNFTCGYCLANAKPYHFTFSDGSAVVGNPAASGPRGVQPDPRAAAMVSEAAELLEQYGDYELGDL